VAATDADDLERWPDGGAGSLTEAPRARQLEVLAGIPGLPGSLQVGVDMVEVGRIARSVAQWGERFLQRVYTDAEQAYCGRRAQQLAGRFAAKEAVSKALGTGVGALRWRDIEVLPDHQGKPAVILHGHAAVRAQHIGVKWFSLSITHTDELALVFVIAG
jgi:holo-[acyl-carrier protein] synthase